MPEAQRNLKADTETDIVQLLRRADAAPQDRELWDTSRKVVAERFGSTGHLWCAVGLDYRPCSMQCKFCAFAKCWTNIREPRVLHDGEVIAWIKDFLAAGSDYIILRTSEVYRVGRLCRFGEKARAMMPEDASLIANTRELTAGQAASLRSAGFDGVYKTVRLREGIDTNFDPEKRLRTIQVIKEAGLKIYSLVEPIGPEHTAEEIARSILLLRERVRPALVGVMARIPVPGSPLAELGKLSEEKLASIQSVTILALLPHLDDVEIVCSHPPSPHLLAAGANGIVVEVGAIPRDAYFSTKEWQKFTVDDAKAMLGATGYEV